MTEALQHLGIDLAPEALMATASAETGLADWGGEEFVEPLGVWLASVVAEGNLNPLGLFGVKGTALRLLMNRLLTHDAIKKHPEILDENVDDPIVVLGMPRTGTTKLQRMLSCNPGAQGLTYWRALNVAPVPGHQPGEPDPRIAIAEASVGFLAELGPDVMAAHPVTVHDAEEDVLLMDPTFESLTMVVYWRTPSFHAWWRNRSRERCYSYERRVLQFLQWQDGGGRGRPWILKSPTHLDGLEAMAEAFPDATLVHCHRDLNVAVPSMVRLIEAGRRMATDDLDLSELGDELLRLWADMLARYVATRQRLEGRLRIIDVSYETIVDDPLAVIRKVYGAHDRVLTDEAERRMREWEGANPQYAFGKVSYSLERYGLTEERIEEAFRPYIEYFGGFGAGLVNRPTAPRC